MSVIKHFVASRLGGRRDERCSHAMLQLPWAWKYIPEGTVGEWTSGAVPGPGGYLDGRARPFPT